MRVLAILLALSALTGPAWACGPDTDCQLGDRHYRIAMPEGQIGSPVGAVVFAHGYRGSAAAVMQNQNLRQVVSDMGLALIALKSADDDWVIPYAPRHMDSDGSVEFRYVEAVIEDAARRFPIDTERLMAAGFSAGGMMVWNLACTMPERFAGFAAIAGTFWMKPPETCATPAASLVHIHGTTDPTVPLAGRPILETRQGDVAESLDMYQALGGFTPTGETELEDLVCQNRRNATGDVLDFCLHPGGHSFRSSYLRFAWEKLQAAGQL
ncbi:putative polyhydroxybutyrate depolymerase [Roseovarius sp. EC-HK134]|uniref:alpha/beta hydrolase family esterase n=1 Tax=unclassified Roseovarius TaxID=2614913 RepID=UPI001250E481|nr:MULTISPECIES: prolyl oligopeptidase family serine peptidase [unclassified Roseovarius]VVT22908.1 putative polyhydroxybutyrate depolymerase [Roseovarius sp. EC-SD190]VVT23099.1 putative polyhydroxybutyrate depolymerase [Roseovarius sp. EC-HK134]